MRSCDATDDVTWPLTLSAEKAPAHEHDVMTQIKFPTILTSEKVLDQTVSAIWSMKHTYPGTSGITWLSRQTDWSRKSLPCQTDVTLTLPRPGAWKDWTSEVGASLPDMFKKFLRESLIVLTEKFVTLLKLQRNRIFAKTATHERVTSVRGRTWVPIEAKRHRQRSLSSQKRCTVRPQ